MRRFIRTKAFTAIGFVVFVISIVTLTGFVVTTLPQTDGMQYVAVILK